MSDAADRFEDRTIDRSGEIDQRPVEERMPAPRIAPRAHGGLNTTAALFPSAHLETRVPDGKYEESVAKVQAKLNALHLKGKGRLDAIAGKIEAQERKCVAPKLDDALQQMRFQRQKLLVANGPALADLLRSEKTALSDLELFKARNGLQRDAHYPSSPIFAFGILMVLVVIEAGLNGILFANTSDQGLLGGWLEALVLSVTNVGTAFLLGRFLFPNLHRKGLIGKAFTLTSIAAGLLAVIAINLAGAHYRDWKEEVAKAAELAVPVAKPSVSPLSSAIPKPAAGRGAIAKPALAQVLPVASETAPAVIRPSTEAETIRAILANPLQMKSFTSFFLFVIGLCGATIAAVDGYKLDDPFPGYGRRHRKFAAAREKTADALKRVLNHSNQLVGGASQDVNRLIGAYSHEISSLQSLHHAYAGEHKVARDELDHALKVAENEAAHWRRLHFKSGLAAGGTDYETLATKPLPPLNEKHTKFLESQDRKVKALQKTITKEQGDILNLLETASASFQSILDEAGRSSLETALMPHSTQPAAT